MLPYPYDVFWFKVSAPERLRERCVFMTMLADGRDPAFCYTSWDGRLQYALILPKGSLSGLRDQDWVHAAVQSAPAWLAEHVLSHRHEIADPTALTVLFGRCREWTAPGVFLIGDAAHPMSPLRAQGINLALRDAIVTANHLVPLLRSGAGVSALDEAARAVQAEREPEVVRAQTLQISESRLARWRFFVAKHLLPRLGRYRWAQRAWLRRQHDLRFGSTEVKLHIAAET